MAAHGRAAALEKAETNGVGEHMRRYLDQSFGDATFDPREICVALLELRITRENYAIWQLKPPYEWRRELLAVHVIIEKVIKTPRINVFDACDLLIAAQKMIRGIESYNADAMINALDEFEQTFNRICGGREIFGALKYLAEQRQRLNEQNRKRQKQNVSNRYGQRAKELIKAHPNWRDERIAKELADENRAAFELEYKEISTQERADIMRENRSIRASVNIATLRRKVVALARKKMHAGRKKLGTSVRK